MSKTDEIVSAAWLKEHLEDPQVVIVDCRFSLADPDEGQKQYETGHIPGAYYLDLNKDLSGPVCNHGGRHPLPNPTELASKLEAIGVSKDETLVVAYDDSRLAFAARLWWLLRYLGHNRVAVLDGGLTGWKSAGYAVTDRVPIRRTGTFVPQVRWSWVVDIEAVKARKDLPGVMLVDSRDPDRYQGLREPIDLIAGHIPSAVNFPWKEVTDSNGFVLPLTEQSRRWESISSGTVPEKSEVIVYCGSGVTACVNLLSLELAGQSGGKLYAGSWSDWCSYR
ncbi:MAG: sulfurtransferase [Hormoscilla sp. SP12CHS1]|nr:sulfurtransferase [Hormoscilla sp. SP12CHS1]